MAEEWTRAKPKAKQEAATDDDQQWGRAAPRSDEELRGTDVLSDSDDPLLTGLLQGASFGFWDEIASKVESAIGGTDYRQNWQARQDEMDRYRRLAPKAMLGGEVAGAVGTMFIPGLGWANVAKAGKLAGTLKAVGLAAGQGALEGIGKSRAIYDDPEYENPNAAKILMPAVDAGKGALEGVIGLGGAKLAGGALKLAAMPIAAKASKAWKWALEKGAKPVFGVPENVAKEVLENPDVYRGKAKTIEEITKQKIIPLANEVSAMASKGKAEARALLNDSPALKPKQVTKIILDKLKKNDVLFPEKGTGLLKSNYGNPVIQQLNTSRSFAESLAGTKGYLSQKELAAFYDSLESAAQYSRNVQGGNKKVANTFEQIRGEINEVLGGPKGSKNEYGKIMETVADQTQSLEKLRKALSFGKGEGVRYAPVDATFGKLRQIRKKEKTEEVLKGFAEKYGGGNIPAEIKRATNETHFGLKAPFVMTGMGLASTSPELAIAGATRDIFGRNIFKQLAVRTNSKAGPGVLDSLLRPAFVTASTSPWSNPDFIGYPLHGISAEEHLRRMQAAQEAEAAQVP